MKLMAQFIDKDALVAEIEKRKSQFMFQADSFHKLGMGEKRDHFAILASNMQSLISFIDTLEVKEVDLEQEATEFVQTKEFAESNESPVLLIAKHFFELGLKTQKEVKRN